MEQKALTYTQLSRACEVVGLGGFTDDDDDLNEEKRASKREISKQALDHLEFALKCVSHESSPARRTALIAKLRLLERYKESMHDETLDIDAEAFGRNGTDQPLNSILLPAAVLTERTTESQESYCEISKALNLAGYEIIWFATLAQYLYRASRDLHLASSVLKEVSSHVFTGQYIEIKYTIYYTASLSEGWLNLASDVVYQQFKSSKVPETKFALLQEAEELPMQPVVQSVQVNTISLLPYLVVLARMQKRIGSPQKYQRTLHQAFDICWDNLHDDFAANDSKTLRYLSKILAVGPNLIREAEVVSSAQLYQMSNTTASKSLELPDSSNESERSAEHEVRNGKEAGENEENLIYDYNPNDDGSMFQDPTVSCSVDEIGHECPNSSVWTTWKRPMYTCLCCTNSFICQDCHDERTRRNNMSSKEVEGKVDFCCDGGEYIKAPVAGWKGIKHGVIHIENEEPIEVNAFLDQLRGKWKQVWEDFWKA